MAWVFDTGGTPVTETDADATVTFSHTVGSLTNGILFVWMVYQTTSTTISSVTYNGVAMTEAIEQTTNRRTVLYYLLNPASGAHDVVISGSANFGRVCAGAHSWSGAHSTQSPQTQTGSGTGTTPSITVGTASGELIVDVLGIAFTSGDTLTVGSNQTERGKITGGATTGASSSQDGADGGVMSWTDSNSRAYGFVTASFDPAPTAQTITVNQVSETDTAQTVGRVKNKAIGQNTETDLAQAIARVKQLAIGLNSEIDSVQAVAHTKQYSVLLVSETDSVQPITIAKRVPVNQVSETDAALSITEAGAQTIAVGQVVEVDSVQPITVRKVVLVAQVSESDLAQQLFPSKRVAVVQVVEIDSTQTITHVKRLGVSQASETDLTQAITWAPKRRLVNQVVEIDSAFAITVFGADVGAHYIYIIPAENRVYLIPAVDEETLQDRTFAIPAESRVVTVPHD